MLNKKIFLSIVFIASMAGCDGKKDEKPLTENVSETSINSSAKKSITLIDGKFAIDIPEGMEEAVNQEGIMVFMNGSNAITLTESDAQSRDADSLFEETKSNMKNQDPNIRIDNEEKVEIAGRVARTMEAQMKSKGRDVYISMILGVFDGKLISVMMMGDLSNKEAVRADGKKLISSIKYEKNN